MEEWKGQGSSLASWVECICIYKLPLKEERQNMLGELQSVLVSSCCCTNYHKYSSLIQCNSLSYSSAVQKFETGLSGLKLDVVKVHSFLEALGKNLFSLPFPASTGRPYHLTCDLCLWFRASNCIILSSASALTSPSLTDSPASLFHL